MTTATKDGTARSSSSARSPAVVSPSLRAVVWLAFAVRLTIFPFAENKQGDAPMRALIAERMNDDATAARDPRSFCQFGPLPIEVMRIFMAVDPDARRSSRVLSFIAGIAAFGRFFALGRRLLGPGSVAQAALALAGLALALSPLHVQASTTAASEALYLFLLLAALERLHAAVTDTRRRDFFIAGALMSLAAVTRYDTWLAVPAVAAALLVFGRRDRRALTNAAIFLLVSAVLPAAYLGWCWAKSGDPFFFGRYIARDHAALAQAVTERLGGTLARLRQVGIWSASFAAAMTPVLFLAACASLGRLRRSSISRLWWRWRHAPAATTVVMVGALAPPVAYLAKGLLLGNFEPLPRFAIAPGVVLLPFAASALLAHCAQDHRPRAHWLRHPLAPIALTTGGALALWAVALFLAFGRPGRVWGGAESIGPLTRLDAEDRAVAAHLLSHRRADEGVLIDTGGYNDIVIAHAARVPAPRSATLSQTRQPIDTLAESRRTTGASWFAIHDESWGRRAIPDWPRDSLRFGHWRVAHAGDAR